MARIKDTVLSRVRNLSLVDKPGELMMVEVERLHVDAEYQRQSAVHKIAEMSRDWSWAACGAILVARRSGKLYVFDGQHRVAAAVRRNITRLPCVVFDTGDAATEAAAFIRANSHRKAVSSVDIYRAALVAKDPYTLAVAKILADCGLTVAISKSPRSFKSTGWAVSNYRADPHLTERVLRLAAEISLRDEVPVRERLLAAIFWMARSVEGGLSTRLESKIRQVGAREINLAIDRQNSAEGVGGSSCWGRGALVACNKRLKTRFSVVGADVNESHQVAS